MSLRDLGGNLRIAELIFKSIKKEITEQEEVVLQRWLNEDEKNRNLFDELTSDAINAELQTLPSYDIQKAEKNVLTRVRKSRTSSWLRYAIPAAAAVLIYFGLQNYSDRDRPEVLRPGSTMAKTEAAKDIPAPASVNAVLTLADGTHLILDSLHNGQVAGNGNTRISKLDDGQLVYDPVAPGAKQIVYNTLTVPRGSKVVNLTLADGTRVILNAASSITFPTSFPGPKREITMTGEGYFEVAPNKLKPFIVKKGDAEIEVLGTHFNVNAYDNEASLNVTLVEGSVRVRLKTSDQAMLLKPGQMAKVSDKMERVDRVNMDEILAWKEGKFRFGEFASITTVMRQISRWYDVEIEYTDEVQGHIGGSIEREANVSQVLNILEMTGIVKFRLEGRKIIVSPR